MYAVLFLMFFLLPVCGLAQSFDQTSPSPRQALFRSFIVPGLGHQYIDNSDWNRGKIHMAADAGAILALVGIRVHVNQLNRNLHTLARSRAGTSLDGKGRAYEIALSNFNSLQEYNDFQLRSRNWNKLIADTPENRWEWESEEDRLRFSETRSKISKSDNQIPVLVTFLIANRVFSGINAFKKARDIRNLPDMRVSYLNEFGQPGFTGYLRFDF